MGALIGSGTAMKELNRVFGDPRSAAYATAKSKTDLFGAIGVGVGNGQDLLAAYKATGVKVDGALWQTYLEEMAPGNVYKIAQARFDGLTRGVAMITQTHNGSPAEVVVSTEANGSIVIDSPYQ